MPRGRPDPAACFRAPCYTRSRTLLSGVYRPPSRILLRRSVLQVPSGRIPRGCSRSSLSARPRPGGIGSEWPSAAVAVLAAAVVGAWQVDAGVAMDAADFADDAGSGKDLTTKLITISFFFFSKYILQCR